MIIGNLYQIKLLDSDSSHLKECYARTYLDLRPMLFYADYDKNIAYIVIFNGFDEEELIPLFKAISFRPHYIRNIELCFVGYFRIPKETAVRLWEELPRLNNTKEKVYISSVGFNGILIDLSKISSICGLTVSTLERALMLYIFDHVEN